VNKRMYIDTVRQFAGKAQAKGVSYAEAVNALTGMYIDGVVQSGANEAEIAKQRVWAAGFTTREYGKFDKSFEPSGAG